MTAKYTPGPWIIGSDKTSVLALTPVDMNNQKPCPKVVDCASGYDAMSYEEAKANARLIAAAPCMLLALTIARAHIRRALDEIPENDGHLAGALAVIGEAITKATGGDFE